MCIVIIFLFPSYQQDKILLSFDILFIRKPNKRSELCYHTYLLTSILSHLFQPHTASLILIQTVMFIYKPPECITQQHTNRRVCQLWNIYLLVPVLNQFFSYICHCESLLKWILLCVLTHLYIVQTFSMFADEKTVYIIRL